MVYETDMSKIGHPGEKEKQDNHIQGCAVQQIINK